MHYYQKNTKRGIIMKKLKSLCVLLLCICLAAAMLSGCSKISLEGKYSVTIDLSSYISSLDMSADSDMGEYYDKFDAELSLDLIYTFDDQNAFTTSVDEEKFKKDFDILEEKYMDYVIEGMYNFAESNGMTKADFDKFFQQENKKTIRESYSEEVAFDEDYNTIIASFTNSAKQNLIISGDKFYITDEKGNKTGYETFDFENDTLTIYGQFDMDGNAVQDENMIYPLVLTKIQ